MRVIISTACKLKGSLETAHSVRVVRPIICESVVTGGGPTAQACVPMTLQLSTSTVHAIDCTLCSVIML